jgi:hypothetical protein
MVQNLEAHGYSSQHYLSERIDRIREDSEVSNVLSLGKTTRSDIAAQKSPRTSISRAKPRSKTPILLDQIRPHLRNSINRTLNIPTHIQRKNTSIHNPQPLRSQHPQPFIHCTNTFRPYSHTDHRMILCTDILPHISLSLFLIF